MRVLFRSGILLSVKISPPNIWNKLIASLKRANLVESLRGPKGGHRLAKAPSDITMSEIVDVLENGINLSRCVDNPEICSKSDLCQTREVWYVATRALYDKLNSIKLSEMIG